jgi:hypothetical protein
VRKVPRNAGQAKSQRRIYRAVSHWTHVSAIVAAGGKPDPDDIEFLLRLGEPVPPDVQAYLADLHGAPRKAKGRPTKHPGQLEYDQFRNARALFDAIHKIRTEGREGRRPLSEAKACAAYAATKKTVKAESVERQYWAAKKKLLSLIERDDTGTHKYFLTREDYLSWETTNLKKVAKNK